MIPKSSISMKKNSNFLGFFELGPLKKMLARDPHVMAPPPCNSLLSEPVELVSPVSFKTDTIELLGFSEYS